MRNTYFNLAWKLIMNNKYRKGTIKLGEIASLPLFNATFPYLLGQSLLFLFT